MKKQLLLMGALLVAVATDLQASEKPKTPITFEEGTVWKSKNVPPPPPLPKKEQRFIENPLPFELRFFRKIPKAPPVPSLTDNLLSIKNSTGKNLFFIMKGHEHNNFNNPFVIAQNKIEGLFLSEKASEEGKFLIALEDDLQKVASDMQKNVEINELIAYRPWYQTAKETKPTKDIQEKLKITSFLWLGNTPYYLPFRASVTRVEIGLKDGKPCLKQLYPQAKKKFTYQYLKTMGPGLEVPTSATKELDVEMTCAPLQKVAISIELGKETYELPADPFKKAKPID